MERQRNSGTDGAKCKSTTQSFIEKSEPPTALARSLGTSAVSSNIDMLVDGLQNGFTSSYDRDLFLRSTASGRSVPGPRLVDLISRQVSLSTGFLTGGS